MKKIVLLMIVFGLCMMHVICAAVPTYNISFQDVFYSETQGAYISGDFPVTVNLVANAKTIWAEKYSAITFQKGFFHIILGQNIPLAADLVNTANMMIRMQVSEDVATYSLTTVPYAIKALRAEEVSAVSANIITGEFTNDISIKANMRVDDDLFVDYKNKKIGIRRENPQSKIDVAGTINVSELLVNGDAFADTLSWAPNTAATKNIYLIPEINQVGIGVSPKYECDINGVINADNFYIDGVPLETAVMPWQSVLPENSSTKNIVFNRPSGNVGIGITVPNEKLDIIGGIRIGKASSVNIGTLQWFDNDFKGYLNEDWASLLGLGGSGQENFATIWGYDSHYNKPEFTGTFSFVYKNGVSVGSSSPDATFSITAKNITDDVFNISTRNETLFSVHPSGNIWIGNKDDIDSIDPDQKLTVKGVVNADKFYWDGRPIQQVVVRGEHWLSSEVLGAIYYYDGFVGIGRSDPGNLLEISQKAGSPDLDPALTFGNKKDDIYYTMGIDADDPQVFRVERGVKLGGETPLFISKYRYLGIGLDNPQANIHVQGDEGLVFGGTYYSDQIIDDAKRYDIALTSLNVTGAGTRMLWYTPKAAFRLGHLDETSALKGKEWDESYLGKFSIGMGRNILVSGNISTAIGGKNHAIYGAYSTILGGEQNTVEGNFSLALGRRAKALHHGTFVWADSTDADFSSTAENQLIIRAGGGVGINTNQTMTKRGNASLSIESPFDETKDLFTIYSKNNERIYITSSANLQVNDKADSNAKLYVSGNMGIGTTETLVSRNNQSEPVRMVVSESSKEKYPMMIMSSFSAVTPAVTISTTGNVFVRCYPENLDALEEGEEIDEDLEQVITRGVLKLKGGLAGNGFRQADGQEITATAPIIVWHSIFHPTLPPTDNVDVLTEGLGYRTITPNIAFVKGRVGIGVTSPNSLLELSNQSLGVGYDPVITFDHDGVDQFSIGMLKSDETTFRIAGGQNVTSPSLVINGENIGLGIINPSANFHGNGTTYVSHVLSTKSDYSNEFELQTASANIDDFYLDKNTLTKGGTPFVTDNDTDIYWETKGYKFVGMGVSDNISATLDISGTINIITADEDEPSFIISDTFTIANDLRLPWLYLKSGSQSSFLHHRQGGLYLGGNPSINITAQFSYGSSPRGGYLGYFIDEGQMNKTDLYWSVSSPNQTLLIDQDVVVNNSYDNENGFIAQNIITIGPEGNQKAVQLEANISREGLYENSRSYTGKDIDWDINSPEKVMIKGINIKLANAPGKTFKDNGVCIGLDVDVENVTVQSTSPRGYRYAGIFLSGDNTNVGIGVTPSVELDVRGSIYAAHFNLKNSTFRTNTINVIARGNLLLSIQDEDQVMIGRYPTVFPLDTGLLVGGAIGAINLKTQSFVARQLSAANGAFAINANRKVGIGTTDPTAQWELSKVFATVPSKAFSFQNITTEVGYADHDSDLIGLGIQIQSKTPSNNLGHWNDESSHTARGIKVDLTGITEISDSNDFIVKGVNIIGASEDYAAVFKGGNVGIGTDEPTVALDVNGDIKIDGNIEGNGGGNLLAEQDVASFNYVLIETTTTNLIINADPIFSDMIITSFNIKRIISNNENDLNSLALTIDNGVTVENNTDIEEVISANGLVLAQIASANQGLFSTALAIGTGLLVDSGVSVNGLVSSNQLAGLTSIIADSTSIQDHMVVANSKVGIGIEDPEINLHIYDAITDAYVASDNSTWKLLQLQNPTALNNRAVGLTLVPTGVVSSNVGSGLAALRSNATTATGSHLILITDPDSGAPAERVRLTNEGKVGIGTTTPAEFLHVAGIMNTNSFYVGVSTNVSQINNSGDIVFDTTLLDVASTLNVLGASAKAEKIDLYGSGAPPFVSGKSCLYADSVTKKIIYATEIDSTFVTGNLGLNIDSNPSNPVLAYYNSDNKLDVSQIRWIDNTIDVIRITKNIDEDNETEVVAVDVLVPSNNEYASSTFDDYAAEKISLSFDFRRNDSSNASFKGMDVDVSGKVYANDRFYGMHVDVADLKYQYRKTVAEETTIYEGTKYAGVIKGGLQSNVAIESGASITTSHNASLSIYNNLTDMPTMVLQDNADIKRLNVKHNGQVELNYGNAETIDSGDQIGVMGMSGKNIVSVLDESDAVLLQIDDSGKVGLGGSPAANLHVMNASTTIPSLISQTGVAGNDLVVNADGYVGISTSNPTSRLSVQLGTDKVFQVDAATLANRLYVKNGKTRIATTVIAGNLNQAFGVNTMIQTGSGTWDSPITGLAFTKDGTAIANTLTFSSDDKVFQSTSGDTLHSVARVNTAAGWVSSEDIFSVTSSGIGIGTSNPSEALEVVGADTDTMIATIEPLFVGSTGIGINAQPKAGKALYVNGTVSANAVTATTLLSAPTINVGPGVNDITWVSRVVKDYDAVDDYTAIDTNIILTGTSAGAGASQVSKNVLGLNIAMTGTTKSGAQSAIGVHSDVSDLVLSDDAKKYAAVFLGGGVQMNQTDVSVTLNDVMDENSYAPLFVGGTGDTVLFAGPENTVVSHNLTATTYESDFYINSQHTVRLIPPSTVDGIAKVGIGTKVSTEIDKALVVSGDIRVGVASNDNLGIENDTWSSLGKKLYFSGGPVIDYVFNNECGTAYYLHRKNERTIEQLISTLILDFTDSPGYDNIKVNADSRIAIGSTISSTFRPIMTVSAYDANLAFNTADLRVGVGIGINRPESILHVYGSASTPNHMVKIENTSTGAANGVLIRQEQIGSVGHLITFKKSDTTTYMGAIYGYENPLVAEDYSLVYTSGGADYAEYIPKQDSSEVMEPGDIVGLYQGKISKKTEGADQVMAISSAPIVAGNWAKNTDGLGLVSFLGQVPLKVIGLANAGDYLIPSGLNDGTAIAVSPKNINLEHYTKIIGRTLDSSDELGIKRVNTVIGFPFVIQAMGNAFDNLDSIKKEINQINKDNRLLQQQYQERIKNQQKSINQLKSEIRAMLP